ncbi:MAG: ribosome-associated translation inhibitor RaiA [Proteobacteria bacterium]|nr:ribosome-associated translation inhibitor RaiA [Pseudomonadota bacterium]
MQVSVTFKNIDPSDALRSYAQKKLDRFDKLLDSPADVNVVFSVEKIRHTAEINLVSDRLNLYAKEESENMYSSIDVVLDKLKKQLTKSRDKMNKRATNSRESIKNTHLEVNEANPEEDGASSYDENETQTEGYSGGAHIQ